MAKDPESSQRPIHHVFPAWTHRLREIGAGVAVLGLIYAGLLIYVGFAPSTLAVGYAPEQPVPYSHRLHVGELGLDCRYCHDTVESSARAALPPAATCMNCHATIKTQSELLEPVRRAVQDGSAVRWIRVHDLPNFVYFDHSAHLTAGISCVSCHGRVDRMDVVRQEAPLSMAFCLDCHRDPDPHLRPPSLVTDLAWQPGPGEAAIDETARAQITPSTACSTCHR